MSDRLATRERRRLLGAPCVLVWLASCGFTEVFGSSGGEVGMVRSIGERLAMTNGTLLISATFTNSGTNVLHGLCYADQVPSGLAVNTVGVQVNGRSVTNFTLEAGQDGDVYAGCTPWRWRLETPTNFPEANPFPAQTTARISYSVSAGAAGVYALQQYCWYASGGNKTNVYFGFGDTIDQRLVKFVSETNLPLLSGSWSADGFAVQLDGAPSSLYLLSASSNLVDWVAVTTNLSPYSFTDTNYYPRRYFRGAMVTTAAGNAAVTSYAANSITVRVSGIAGAIYVLERSGDLAQWLPLATNLAPFSFVDTNIAAMTSLFYRGSLWQAP